MGHSGTWWQIACDLRLEAPSVQVTLSQQVQVSPGQSDENSLACRGLPKELSAFAALVILVEQPKVNHVEFHCNLIS